MAVNARFTIDRVTKHAAFQGVEVHMSPVIGRGNEEWAKYTPSGELRMNVNGPAASWFEERLGQQLTLAFDDAPTEKES